MKELPQKTADDIPNDIKALDALLRKVGIILSKNTLSQMLDAAPDLKNLTSEEAEIRIQLLRDIGCSDRKISGIVSSCSYLLKSISEIKKLFSTLNRYGFTNLNSLFFANPLILDLDSFEIEEYIKGRIERGETEEDVVNDLQDKPYLFQESGR